MQRYQINDLFASKLRALKGYEIVFICDDSSSMKTRLGGVTQTNAEIPATRWQLLQRTVCIVVDAAATLDPDGVDIFFLNRGPKRNVRSSNEVKALFRDLPDGPTPIVPKMREIFEEKKEEIRTRKLLLLIATDGQPTDFNGHAQIDEFRQALCNRQPIDHIPVTIIACTDDRQSMEYLNKWDKEIPRLDVVSDYQTERKQILNCQGQNFPFSFGDYVMKILMGGVDDWFDQLDEKKVTDAPSQPQSRGRDYL